MANFLQSFCRKKSQGFISTKNILIPLMNRSSLSVPFFFFFLNFWLWKWQSLLGYRDLQGSYRVWWCDLWFCSSPRQALQLTRAIETPFTSEQYQHDTLCHLGNTHLWVCVRMCWSKSLNGSSFSEVISKVAVIKSRHTAGTLKPPAQYKPANHYRDLRCV